MRVFLDRSNITPSGNLETYIQRKLDATEFLILIASSNAAKFDPAKPNWVSLETEYWLEQRGTSAKLLIALVGEKLESSVPPPVAAILRSRPEEQWPLYVRLIDRDASASPLASPRNARFPDAVAQLAAAVQGVDKDALIARDLREERRNRRLLRIALAAGTALLLFACASAGLAWVQRGHALDEARRAVELRDLAESRQLAAQAATLRQSDPNKASLLSVGAYRIAPTTEARAALFASLGAPGFIPADNTFTGHTTINANVNGDLIAIPVDITGSDRGVVVWDRLRHQRRALLSASSDAVAFLDPAGRYVATGGAAGNLEIWDTLHPNKPASLVALPDGTGQILSLAVSAQKGILVGSTGAGAGARPAGLAIIWDIRDPLRPKRSTVISVDDASVVGLSADGQTLVSSSLAAARLWDISDAVRPRPRGTLSTGWDVASLALAIRPGALLTSRSGTLATAYQPVSILWDTSSGAPRAVDTLPFASGAFAPDRPLLTVLDGRQIAFYDVSGSKPTKLDYTLTAPDDLTTVGFSPDGQWLIAAAHDGAWLWDVSGLPATGAAGILVDSPATAVTALALAPRRALLAVGTANGTLDLWSLADARRPARIASTREPNPPRQLSFSADGGMLAVAGDLYAADDPRASEQGTSATCFAELRTVTATGLGNPLRLPVAPPVSSLFVAADGGLAAATTGDGTDVWAIDRAKLRITGRWSDAGHVGIAMIAGTPSGQTLLVDTGVSTVLAGPNVVRVATSPVDNNGVGASRQAMVAVASGTDRRVRLLDLADPAHPVARGTTAPLPGTPRSLVFAGGDLLVAGSDGSGPQVWDVSAADTPQPVASLDMPGPPSIVAGAASGTLVAAGGPDGRVAVWETDPSRQIEQICAAVGDLGGVPEWDASQHGRRAPCP